MIVRGRLKPGQQLKQRELAAKFDISSTPVREALRLLESEGLVRNDLNRGTRVIDIQHEAAEENFRIRAALEGLATSLAVERMTDRDLADVTAIHEQLRACPPNDRRISELNRRLHFRIYESSGSTLLLSLLRLLWQSLPGGPQVLRPQAESIRQHESLIAALRTRDSELAAEATQRHILSALDYLRPIGNGRRSSKPRTSRSKK